MDIIKLSQLGEGNTLEYKRNTDALDSILKSVSAFANTAGGIILIGIEDNGTIVGVSDIGKIQEQLSNSILNRIKPPYNVNSLTQNKAIELLKLNKENYKQEVMEQRELLSAALKKLPFVVKVYPSEANFILIKTTDANGIYNKLLEQKIVIRNRTKEQLCENCLRITVGTPEENQLLINALNF